ncbi:MAG TPA: IclR family transcriptional regulator [Reyranella sp.]|jgi:DNA-binding IclR family transcriptional regulator|nr:IclR family transcriptional regulator [Reyranella sp.]
MTVRTADRTLDIFESFARRQRPIIVSDLARELSLPTSTCFALVRTLVDRGFLYYLRPRGALYPTRRLGKLAEAIGHHDPIAQNIRPHLEALRDQTGETVILGKLQGLGVVYLEIIESRQAVRYTMTVGAVRELHASSIGKAIVAAMEEEPRERLLAKLKYPRLTEHTIRSRAQYMKSLDEGRKRGYWTNVGESSPDVMGVALSVRIFGDLYGINLVGPQSRFDRHLKSYANALKATVRKVGAIRISLYDE